MSEPPELPALLSPEEIHALGITMILEDLQKVDRVTITGVETRLGQEPQVVGTRWGSPAFITVRTAMYPARPTLTADEFFLIHPLARAHGATPFFARVTLACMFYRDGKFTTNEDLSRPLREAQYEADYRGLLLLGTPAEVTVLGGRRPEGSRRGTSGPDPAG